MAAEASAADALAAQWLVVEQSVAGQCEHSCDPRADIQAATWEPDGSPWACVSLGVCLLPGTQ